LPHIARHRPDSTQQPDVSGDVDVSFPTLHVEGKSESEVGTVGENGVLEL